MHKYSISVVIPVHYQASLVDDSIAKITSFLEDHAFDYEIILVDSGGSDGSSEKCGALARANPNIRIIADPTHTKFGAKMKIGYNAALKDLIWPVVLDLPFPLEKILEAEPLFDKYDAVLSHRSEDPRGLWRRSQSLIYNFMIRLLLGVRVKHINSAFRVYKREFIQSLDLISDGWFIDAEVVYYIRKKNIPYTEISVPIVINDTRLVSSVGILTFIEVLREMLYFISHKKI